MDEHEFERRAADAWKHLLDLFENVEPEDADVEASGDVVRIDLRGGQRIVLNTQRPTRQLWLAGGQRAWHFSYEAATQRWLDDKGHRDELFTVITQLVKDGAGVEINTR
jgi:CyaY protein